MLDICRWAALAAFLVLIVAGTGAIILAEQVTPPGYEQTAAEDTAKGHDQSDSKSLWNTVFPDSISLYTLFLVIFTAVLALAGIIQLNLLNRAERIAVSTAQATQDAAKAAKKSADALMAGQRAVLVPTPYWAPDGGSDLQAWVFGVSWQNAGNLATRGMRNHIDYRFIESDLPKDFEFPDTVEPLSTGAMLGPKQLVLGPHIPKDGNISAAQIGEIQRAERHLFFFGWARYFDGFPDTPERVTKFCYRVRVTGNPQMPFVFPPCDQHNCADEGCNEQ